MTRPDDAPPENPRPAADRPETPRRPRRLSADPSAELAGISEEEPGVAGVPVRTGEMPVVPGEPTPEVRGRSIGITVLAVLAVLVLAMNLRPAATAVGPVLTELQQGLDMGGATAGLLTALPGFCFAVFGAFAVTLSRRAGLSTTLVFAGALITLGLLVRAVVGSVPPFLILSIVALAGIALGNVLVPVAVKRWFPGHSAIMTSAYTVFLAVGATLPGLVAVPIAASAPDGWRLSLAVWGAAAALALLIWIPLAIRERRLAARTAAQARAEVAEAAEAAEAGGVATASVSVSRPDSTANRRPVWRSPRAVALGIFFGVQSGQAYIMFGWLPQMFRDAGLDAGDAALMGALLAAFGIPTGLVMPLIVGRFRDVRGWTVGMGLFLTAGYVGLLIAPTTVPWLWVVFLGLSSAAFPTAIALIGARSVAPDVTADLSGFSQSLGYLLAALGPLAVGAAFGAIGAWRPILIVLALSGIVMAVTGSLASRPGAVDDELAPPAAD